MLANRWLRNFIENGRPAKLIISNQAAADNLTDLDQTINDILK
jgi:hypothetical protein